ncbi:hypothetical protein FRB90_008527 [Tulasnella sp. 427]|nr:hypothetical protein FRB90_008527 [Tulasnella sp. 427]
MQSDSSEDTEATYLVRDAEYVDSDHSSASTEVYEDQRPFTSHAPLICKLAEELFYPDKVAEIEHMRGGGFNRVTGVTLSTGRRLVIRSPRFNEEADQVDVLDQAAVLRYLKTHSSIPLPNILYFSGSSDNHIQWPYMVQDRVEARSLHWFLSNLEPNDLMSMAREVVEVTSRICSTAFPSAGVIHANAPPRTDGIRFTLPGLAHEVPTPETPYYDASSFLSDCFNTQISSRRAVYASDTWVTGYLKRIKAFAMELAVEKPFTNRFSLWHPDFEPRNILARKLDSGEFVIEAVLDFDGAVSAPIEMAWTLPHWLWTWDAELRHGDVERADETPEDDERQMVKDFVETEMERRVPGFMEVWRTGKSARELFYFALNGFNHGQHLFKRANALLGLGSEDNLGYIDSEDSDSSGGDTDSVASRDG